MLFETVTVMDRCGLSRGIITFGGDIFVVGRLIEGLTERVGPHDTSWADKNCLTLEFDRQGYVQMLLNYYLYYHSML